ncbi:hypothetical protein BGX28_004050 [Mortierella sp. GBA30]|nr:hypothetical protein BGX28_004050 [Mortierella sp. GBA30]
MTSTTFLQQNPLQTLPRVIEEIVNEDDGRISIHASPEGSELVATTAILARDDAYYDQYNDSDAETPCSWTVVSKDTLQEGQILKAGYLMKKGERLKIWKRKWFVLRTSKLACYKDNKEYELLRIIDIRDVHRAAEVPVKHKSGVFVILTPRRTFTVQANDPSEMRNWIQAINHAKLQSEFMASSSDLDSCPGSTVQLGLTHQQRLGPANASLMDKGDKAHSEGTHAILQSTQATHTRTASSPKLSIYRKAMSLSLITTGTKSIEISNPSSPRMEQVHAGGEPPVGSFSSGVSYAAAGAPPETPCSPGLSGGELFWMNGDHNLSSGEEELDDDPSALEAGRLASEVDAPGSGIVTCEQLESKVVRQGYLLKLGNKYKTWRKKWFVLRGDKLTYYKNTKEYQPHGIIPLSTIIDCLQTDPVSKSKQYCLRIVTSKRSFVCCAPDEDTLLQWLDMLHVECDRVAQEAHKEAVADHLAQMAHHHQDSGASLSPLQESNDGDGDDEGKQPLGRAARIKKNLHSTLPRHKPVRSKSKPGEVMVPAGDAQLCKAIVLESTASTPSSVVIMQATATQNMPSISFQIPVIPSVST